MDVAQIALLVVTQSLVLAGGEVATNSSDVVKSALIRANSQAAGGRLDGLAGLVISLNGAWSLPIELSLAVWAELYMRWLKLHVLRDFIQLIGDVLVVSLASR